MPPKKSSSRPFQTLSSRVVWSCPWYHVRQDQIVRPDGSSGEYNVVEHEGAVWVVPVTTDGQVVLIRHYRYTVDDWCFEVPAGGLQDGHSPEEVARAELREEIGGVGGTLRAIGTFYTSNGISNEQAHVFLASGLSLRETAHEPAEVLELHPVPIEQALRMAHDNKISDGPSALALLLCEPHLQALA